jgi:tRNA(fMet)-specific endonuclease VapC
VGVLIDTSVLIGVERGVVDVDKFIARRSDEPFFISTISASELLHSVHRPNSDAVRRARSAFVESILANFPILPIDLETARAHAQLWASLAAAGNLIGAHDMWLAATCIARGYSIATANVRDFGRVEGLRVEKWS